MKASILPLNSLWLKMERGLDFRIRWGLGGRVGGLGRGWVVYGWYMIISILVQLAWHLLIILKSYFCNKAIQTKKKSLTTVQSLTAVSFFVVSTHLYEIWRQRGFSDVMCTVFSGFDWQTRQVTVRIAVPTFVRAKLSYSFKQISTSSTLFL